MSLDESYHLILSVLRYCMALSALPFVTCLLFLISLFIPLIFSVLIYAFLIFIWFIILSGAIRLYLKILRLSKSNA